MILYLRYCRTGVLFHITVHVKDQYVTTYGDVILVKPNRICASLFCKNKNEIIFDTLSLKLFPYSQKCYSGESNIKSD